MMLVDPLLVLSLSACFLSFWESLVAEEHAVRWRIASAAALGLAFLAKGPVGGIFFIALAGYTAWRMPSLRTKFQGGWLPAVAVFALVVAAWYLPAYLIDRQVFVQKFIVEQNLNRFAGGDEAHAVRPPIGLLYYLPILFLGFIPWSVTAFKSWPVKGELSAKTYLAAWATIIFAFFTMSTTKLPHYVLPCLPPLSLLVGAHLSQRPFTRARLGGFLAGAACLGLIATFGFWGYWQSFHAEVQGLTLEAKSLHATSKFALYALAKNPNPSTGQEDQAPEPKLFGLIPIRINETSHPSLLLYLDRNVTETDRFQDLLTGEPTVIITRPGRLPADAVQLAAAKHLSLTPMPTNTRQIFYRVFVLQPQT
jgi:4-amino-4-deoxy-L-arabinose transferase-like glycosyltransferase